MHAQILEIDLQTDGAGDAVGLIGPISGEIINIIYEKDGSNPYLSTVNFNITTETSKQNLWVAQGVDLAQTVAPQQQCHDTLGSGTTKDCTIMAVGVPGENVKVVLDTGGANKDGKFKVIWR